MLELALNCGAMFVMGLGVYLSPPEARGVALVLAAGLWFIKPVGVRR